MSNHRAYIDGWLASARDTAQSNQWTTHQKHCLLAYDAGRCWALALVEEDIDVMLHGFAASNEIQALRDKLDESNGGA